MSTEIIPNNGPGTVPSDERNIEIKARVGDDEEFKRRVDIARKLTGTEGELIVQKDVFFNSQSGRLKLRYLQPPACSQLVYYDRPDVAGPKLSKYNKIETNEPEVLEKILTNSNGAKGILEKTRYLFMHNHTRIHMDKVKNLGNFMEFEVCLKPEQTISEGQAVADELMKVFGIEEKDLMTGAYFDEIQK
ncbi:uncharacterized protein LOC119675608 [Teleopsis dalmanni]|uniref:uncharacterized protein LOC119669352 n=1 Tax=Teleopsis dalmanni TaxID=139649 RepID=UPI0018CE0931|nr:uncharacterized protein LOC119669352 [Teleopsis dalmanni]XP_037942743.1 uncharacterized protein LOC119675608 [Teleopsis dalmanni]